MALETGNYIGDLVITNPASGDAKSAGDDHLRLIKTALKTSFAGFTGSIILTGSDTGGVNNYALTPTPALPAYVTGMMVLFNPSATNTTTSTINISALGAKTIKTVDGAALASGDFVTGVYHLLIYDGTDFRLVGITKSYADNLSFSSSLPSQTGNGGKYITTDGTSASWADPFASAPLTGTPTAPTAAADTNTTQIATTAYVIGQGYAKLASPALTGTPTAPTGTADITTSQIINAAWYNGQKGTASPIIDGTATAGTSKKWSPIDHVHPTDTSRAALASPTFTGTPSAPTAAADTNTTQLATTAFVIGQAYAKLASPALTGTPTVPTAAADTNTTQAASTAFVLGQSASTAQMAAAVNTTTYSSPGRLNSHPGVANAGAKAGPSGNLLAEYNVSSVTDGGTGIITFNYTTAMATTNYGVNISYQPPDSTPRSVFISNMATGSCSAQLVESRTSPDTWSDPTYWEMMAYEI